MKYELRDEVKGQWCKFNFKGTWEVVWSPGANYVPIFIWGWQLCRWWCAGVSFDASEKGVWLWSNTVGDEDPVVIEDWSCGVGLELFVGKETCCGSSQVEQMRVMKWTRLIIVCSFGYIYQWENDTVCSPNFTCGAWGSLLHSAITQLELEGYGSV